MTTNTMPQPTQDEIAAYAFVKMVTGRVVTAASFKGVDLTSFMEQKNLHLAEVVTPMLVGGANPDEVQNMIINDLRVAGKFNNIDFEAYTDGMLVELEPKTINLDEVAKAQEVAEVVKVEEVTRKVMPLAERLQAQGNDWKGVAVIIGGVDTLEDIYTISEYIDNSMRLRNDTRAKMLVKLELRSNEIIAIEKEKTARDRSQHLTVRLNAAEGSYVLMSRIIGEVNTVEMADSIRYYIEKCENLPGQHNEHLLMELDSMVAELTGSKKEEVAEENPFEKLGDLVEYQVYGYESEEIVRSIAHGDLTDETKALIEQEFIEQFTMSEHGEVIAVDKLGRTGYALKEEQQKAIAEQEAHQEAHEQQVYEDETSQDEVEPIETIAEPVAAENESRWSMPDWMKPFESMIIVLEGTTVEEILSRQFPGHLTNEGKEALFMSVGQQVKLLTDLREKGCLLAPVGIVVKDESIKIVTDQKIRGHIRYHIRDVKNTTLATTVEMVRRKFPREQIENWQAFIHIEFNKFHAGK